MALGHFDLEDVLHTRRLLEEEAALDGKFHVAVALASGNPLLAHLMGSMREAVTEHLVKQELDPAKWPKPAAAAQKSHRALRDADAVAEQVFRHTAFYDEAANQA